RTDTGEQTRVKKLFSPLARRFPPPPPPCLTLCELSHSTPRIPHQDADLGVASVWTAVVRRPALQRRQRPDLPQARVGLAQSAPPRDAAPSAPLLRACTLLA